MSLTAVENKGPNKALYRTTALAGSALMWGVLGYLALTYVPKFERPAQLDGPIVDTYKVPRDIIDPPKPPPVKPDEIKQTPDLRVAETTAKPPVITVRTPNTTRANPLPSEFSAGPPPMAPATSTGDDTDGQIIAVAPPEPFLPTAAPTPIVEPIAPPVMPKLVVNPVRLSGVNPIFPTRPLERGISGQVTLSFTVTATGAVEGIDVTGEEPRGYGFARAAREAIAAWRFAPQTIDGVAVAYPARYTIAFNLED